LDVIKIYQNLREERSVDFLKNLSLLVFYLRVILYQSLLKLKFSCTVLNIKNIKYFVYFIELNFNKSRNSEQLSIMYFHSIALSALLLVAGAAGRNLRSVDVDESRVQELRSKLNLLEEMVASKKETEKENLFEDIQERKNRLKIEQNEKQESFDALEAREGRVNELMNKVNSMKKGLESRIKNEEEEFNVAEAHKERMNEIEYKINSLKKTITSKMEDEENSEVEESNAAEVHEDRISKLRNKIDYLKKTITSKMEDEEYTQTLKEEEEEARELFKMLDLDNDGFITSTEMLYAFEKYPNEFTLDDEDGIFEWTFKKLDLDNNGFITLDEYEEYLHKVTGHVISDEEYKEFYDSDIDGDGQVSYEELVMINLFSEADEDEDGQISYEEFLNA